GGNPSDGRKVKGTLHWVSAQHAIPAEVRMYDRLFTTENPNIAPEGEDFTVNLNPNSLEVLTGCMVEPNLIEAKIDDRFQFMRQGYFVVDKDSTPDNLVFNRTVGLRDSWAKSQK
ncbi:MAG: glutamine--tRNA ligase, partial [Anaerolineae bacterium]|nr:glutamine--tRNA ligase [Anaerolineae bacterium]